MAPRVDPVATDETLPAHADVVIIGGGIIGTSAALFLAERGVSTVLCEKGHIAGEQSSRNWGWCRKMARDPREIPLVIESLRLWQGMNQRVEAETGFRTCGIMYLAESQDDLARLAGWLDHARDYQLDTRVDRRRRGGAPAARLRQTLGRRPLHAERRQGRAADGGAGDRRGGAAAWRDDPRGVRGARHRDRSRAGRGRRHRKGPHRLPVGRAGGRRVVAAVLRQSRHRAAAAQGAGLGDAHRAARRRPRDLGLGRAVRLSQADGRRLYGRHARRAHDRSRPRQSSGSCRNTCRAIRLHWKKLRLRVGRRFAEEWRTQRRWSLDQPSPFEAVRVLDPAADPFVLERARASIAEAFPAFRNVAVAESWGGMIDVMPDAIPVISAVDALPGFFIATGFSGHGFGIGPGAGRLVADMVTGAPPIVDPAPFRLSRFSDGSNPLPHPLAS